MMRWFKGRVFAFLMWMWPTAMKTRLLKQDRDLLMPLYPWKVLDEKELAQAIDRDVIRVRVDMLALEHKGLINCMTGPRNRWGLPSYHSYSLTPNGREVVEICLHDSVQLR